MSSYAKKKNKSFLSLNIMFYIISFFVGLYQELILCGKLFVLLLQEIVREPCCSLPLARVGKSSIISSFLSDNFPENVDPVLCEVIIPAECTTNNCSLTIVDTSCIWIAIYSNVLAVEDDHDITCEQIRIVSLYYLAYMQADVVIIVYSLDLSHSWDSVINKWIPLVLEVGGDNVDLNTFQSDSQKPIVIVGNKLDVEQNPSTLNRITHLRKHASTVLSKYLVGLNQEAISQSVECCMECSARTRQNIRELFYTAQRTITFPLQPLFDKATQSLRHEYSCILRRVFRFFDRNQDGYWNSTEMNVFQVALAVPPDVEILFFIPTLHAGDHGSCRFASIERGISCALKRRRAVLYRIWISGADAFVPAKRPS